MHFLTSRTDLSGRDVNPLPGFPGLTNVKTFDERTRVPWCVGGP
ncbi:MAG TPA: hypothetical protein VIC62_01195 [Nakamurella sp.]|jgi:hypothetical protein